MAHALSGGLWLHRFVLNGQRWAHLVSSDRDALLLVGELLGMRPEWLQYKPLKRLDTGERTDAWHWDLRGPRLVTAVRLAAPPAPPRSPLRR
jgi:hypothetical protein